MRRFAAVVLLALFGFGPAYALSPLLASQCICDHPADVPCDCPHHQGQSEDAPPCHRHHAGMKATGKAAPAGAKSLRNHCGAKPPQLVLAALGVLPTPIVPTLTAARIESRDRISVHRVERALPPPRRPPRA